MAKKKKEEQVEAPVEETVEQTTPETAEAPEVNPWEEKYNAEYDAHLRLAADYDNFRKRTIKEKEASYANGKADAIEKKKVVLAGVKKRRIEMGLMKE